MFNDNVLNLCIDLIYLFYEKVIIEIWKMYVGLIFFYFGGDEVVNGVWLNFIKCCYLVYFRNFIELILVYLKKYYVYCVVSIFYCLGFNFVGWEDGFVDEKGIFYNWMFLLNKEVYINVW